MKLIIKKEEKEKKRINKQFIFAMLFFVDAEMLVANVDLFSVIPIICASPNGSVYTNSLPLNL